MNGWLGEDISTLTSTTIKVEYLPCSENSQRDGAANTGATLYPQRLCKLWPHTLQCKDLNSILQTY